MTHNRRDNSEIATGLRKLNWLAKLRRKERLAAGALELASPEIKFVKDENHNPVDVEMYQLRETNSMVEEFMLMANVSVAKKILEHYPSFSVLRRHPHPEEKNLKSLVQAAKQLGVTLQTGSSKALAQSLDAAKV